MWAACPRLTAAATSPTSPSLAQPPATQLAARHRGWHTAKLYAALLERRVSDWAEGTGQCASCQFGFRCQRSTSHAHLVLRTLQDGYRVTGSAQLWACFVDFKQAFDSVPRDRLWAHLEEAGVGAG